MEFRLQDSERWQLETAEQLFYLQRLSVLSESQSLVERLQKIKEHLMAEDKKFRHAQLDMVEKIPQEDPTDMFNNLLGQYCNPPHRVSSSANQLTLVQKAKQRLHYLGLRSKPRTICLNSTTISPKLKASSVVNPETLLQKLKTTFLNLKDKHAQQKVAKHKDSVLHTFWMSGWKNGLNDSVLLDSCYALHKVEEQKFVLTGTRILDGLYRSVCAIISKDNRSFDQSVLYDESEIQHIVHYREEHSEDLYSFGFKYEQASISVFRNLTHLADVLTKHSSSYGPDGVKPNYARGAVMLGHYLVYVSEKQTLNYLDIRTIIQLEAKHTAEVPLLELPIEEFPLEQVQDIRLDKEAVCPTGWVLAESGAIYSLSFEREAGGASAELAFRQLHREDKEHKEEFHTTIAAKDHHLVFCSMNQPKKQVLVHRMNKHTGRGHYTTTLEVTMNPVHQILLISLEGIIGYSLFHLVVLVGEMKTITLLLLHQTGQLTFWSKSVLPSTNTYLYVVQDMGTHPELDEMGEPTGRKEHSVLLAGVSKTKIIFNVGLLL